MTTSFSPDLLVSDVDRASRFLQLALAFKELDRVGPPSGPVWAMLARDNQRVMVEAAGGAEDPDTKRLLSNQGGKLGASVHFYLSVDDLDEEVARLRGAGVEFQGPIHKPYGMREIAFRDPDGYSWLVGQRTPAK
jgi:catechol 2,3-dioxygenase-like lactoylglutathione lyase family enzyme